MHLIRNKISFFDITFHFKIIGMHIIDGIRKIYEFMWKENNKIIKWKTWKFDAQTLKLKQNFLAMITSYAIYETAPPLLNLNHPSAPHLPQALDASSRIFSSFIYRLGSKFAYQLLLAQFFTTPYVNPFPARKYDQFLYSQDVISSSNRLARAGNKLITRRLENGSTLRNGIR